MKSQKISFLGLYVLLTDLKDIQSWLQNRSKNKLVRENAWIRVHGSCSLRFMGSWSGKLFKSKICE